MALQLRSAGHVVRRLDIAEELPSRLGDLLRWLYFTQLRLLTGSWGSRLRWLARDAWAFKAVRRVLGLLGRGLVQEVSGARVVVSTHPCASQALGEARARGLLPVPVVTYLPTPRTPLWVHPHVDLHLAIHEITAGQARGLGGTTAVVRPVVADENFSGDAWLDAAVAERSAGGPGGWWLVWRRASSKPAPATCWPPDW